MHEYVESRGDARRRARREESARARPDGEAVGEDVARAGLESRHRISREGGTADVARQTRLQPRRLRLHDVHRQLGSVARSDFARRSRKAIWWSSSVLSGNRNFEGRVHQEVRTNWLASPPLVVAYAIAGTMRIDLSKDPIGKDKKGKDVFLKDIWPSNKEVARRRRASVRRHVRAAVRRRVHRTGRVAGDQGRRERHVRLGELDVHQTAAVLQSRRRSRSADRNQRRADSRAAR